MSIPTHALPAHASLLPPIPVRFDSHDLAMGAPVSGERVVQQAGILLYTKIVLMYGTVAYAAHQVGLSIESLSFLPGYGFAIAAATMVGQSIGAGWYTGRSWKPGKRTAGRLSDVGHGSGLFLFPMLCSAPSPAMRP